MGGINILTEDTAYAEQTKLSQVQPLVGFIIIWDGRFFLRDLINALWPSLAE